MLHFHGGTNSSFAVGHIALAYLLGKSSALLLKTKISIPLVIVLSILPDIDIILFTSNHRGPTHSIITAAGIFIPAFIFYRKKAIPYFLSLISHSIVADFLIGGQLQLLWPLTTQEFGFFELGFPYIAIYDQTNILLELALFVISTTVTYKTGDLFKFFRNSKLNLIYSIPIFTVLLPAFIGYPLNVPVLLNFPHLFYLVVFSVAVFASFLPKL